MGHNCHSYLSFKLIPLKLSFTTAVYIFGAEYLIKCGEKNTLEEQRTSSNQQNWCLITSKSFQWDWTEIERYNYVACFWHTDLRTDATFHRHLSDCLLMSCCEPRPKKYWKLLLWKVSTGKPTGDRSIYQVSVIPDRQRSITVDRDIDNGQLMSPASMDRLAAASRSKIEIHPAGQHCPKSWR